MRLRGLRHNRWAAWLGVAALALNALVSIHLAFDLAEALGRSPHSHGPHSHGHARPHGLEWHLLAGLSGHVPHAHDHDHDKGPGKGHRPNCAVCNSLGSLASLVPGAHQGISVPTPHVVLPMLAAAPEWHDGTPVAAYRSRAPPLL